MDHELFQRLSDSDIEALAEKAQRRRFSDGEKRVSSAVGEGSMAVKNVHEYLSEVPV